MKILSKDPSLQNKPFWFASIQAILYQLYQISNIIYLDIANQWA